MNSDEKKMVRIAERHGARVERSTKHIQVFDGAELVATLSQGSAKNGDTSVLRTIWRRRGWLS
jgi:hypothetical protein